MPEHELMAAVKVAEEEQQRRTWGQATEFLAQAVELLSAIANRLAVGMPVVPVKKIDKPDDPVRIDRPSWVKAEDDAEVVSPAEFFRMMRG